MNNAQKELHNTLYKNSGLSEITTLSQVRRNSLISSSILLSIVMFNFKITGGNFLGLKIDNFEPRDILRILFLITLYYYINFIGHSISNYNKNKLESTGIKPEQFLEVYGSNFSHDDRIEDMHFNDVENSTIITWFCDKSDQVFYQLKDKIQTINSRQSNINNNIKSILFELDTLNKRIDRINSTETKDIIEAINNSINSLNIQSSNVSTSMEKNMNEYSPTYFFELKSELVKSLKSFCKHKRWKSLSNFDKFYKNACTFKFWRSLVFDYLIPFIIGGMAICYYAKVTNLTEYVSLNKIFSMIAYITS